MEKIINTKKYILFTAIIVVLLFSFSGVNQVLASAQSVYPPITAYCSVNTDSLNIDGRVVWYAMNVSGGTGSYYYTWSGTDGLASHGAFVSKYYSRTGTKTATFTIISGDRTISRTCTTHVDNVVIFDDLSVSCSASPSTIDVGEDVTWRATVSGGNGSYRYDWSGTDGLTGNSRTLVWNYDNVGTKRAYVSVTSGNQIVTDSCSTRVSNTSNRALSASCYTNPANPQVGVRMNWYCNVSGGDGDYTYDWSGTGGMDSTSRSPYITYDTVGTKNVSVTIKDGSGHKFSKVFFASVKSVLSYTQEYQTPTYPLVYADQTAVQPATVASVYLSQVPYTGVEDNYNLAIFFSILAAISAYITYAVMAYKKNNA